SFASSCASTTTRRARSVNRSNISILLGLLILLSLTTISAVLLQVSPRAETVWLSAKFPCQRRGSPPKPPAEATGAADRAEAHGRATADRSGRAEGSRLLRRAAVARRTGFSVLR